VLVRCAHAENNGDGDNNSQRIANVSEHFHGISPFVKEYDCLASWEKFPTSQRIILPEKQKMLIPFSSRKH
jgi:hypothetical protein